MRNQSSFQVMVIIPLTAIVCFGLGYQVAANKMPTDLVERSIIAILAFWIAISLIEMIVRVVLESLTILSDDDSARSRQIIYLVNYGDVVERLSTRRGFFDGVDDLDTKRAVGNFLGKLMGRKVQQDGPANS